MEAILTREVVVSRAWSRLIAVMVFVTFISLGAFVRIPLPFTPVPVTLQTFFVLLCAALLGAGLGAAVPSMYISLGLLGLPIFAGAGCGLFYLMGPTGGYIAGFIFASIFAGRFIKYGKGNLFAVFSILLIADLIILSCGILWLRFLLGYSLTKLLLIGFIPFIPGDLLKVFLATILYLKLKSRFKEIL